MVTHGRVQNGVVVLDNGVRWPEGQEVTVLAQGTVLTTSQSDLLVFGVFTCVAPRASGGNP